MNQRKKLEYREAFVKVIIWLGNIQLTAKMLLSKAHQARFYMCGNVHTSSHLEVTSWRDTTSSSSLVYQQGSHVGYILLFFFFFLRNTSSFVTYLFSWSFSSRTFLKNVSELHLICIKCPSKALCLKKIQQFTWNNFSFMYLNSVLPVRFSSHVCNCEWLDLYR